MTLILGLDPGKTTGWGLIDLDESGRITIKDFGEFFWDRRSVDSLQGWIKVADKVVYEYWFTEDEKAKKGDFKGDVMWAPQAIGLIKGLCLLAGREPIGSNRSVKPVAYGLMGMKYVKGKKGMHSQDALCHAIYHAVKKLGAVPPSSPKPSSTSIPFSRSGASLPKPHTPSSDPQKKLHIPNTPFGTNIGFGKSS